MADPYSISGGVVGVVSLGLTVSQGLIAYYGPWKSYDDEISGFTTRLEGLQHSLQVLHEFISPEQELDLPSDQYKKIVSLQLKSCEDACQKLEGMLDKCKSTDTSPFVRKHDWLRLKRASYPFKKETLVTLSQYVSGLQDNLNLSLQLLNGFVSLVIPNSIADLLVPALLLHSNRSRSRGWLQRQPLSTYRRPGY